MNQWYCLCRMNKSVSSKNRVLSLAISMLVGGSGLAAADGGVSFTDIAQGDGAGISYRSNETPSDAIWDALKQRSLTEPYDVFVDGPSIPGKSRGNPGISVFDYDGDGDLDLFVTNSGGDLNGQTFLGRADPNSLYSNQYVETGTLTFVDVAVAAGVDLPDQGSTGTCFGDIDNDGDQDLYVTGVPINHMLVNQGDGTFVDITDTSGTAAGGQYPSSCSFGDVNGDGLLDLAVANSYDNWDNRFALRDFAFANLMKPNQLFLNKGSNQFDDVSLASGIQNISRISWGIAIVDYDLDGDQDIITADDQGAKPPAAFGGVDSGMIRVYQNDGTGAFTDVTEAVGTDLFGAWMGISFADLNKDGNLDIFGTNAGDYMIVLMGPVVGGGKWSSRWLLGQDDGTFIDPGLATVNTSGFGWGTATLDYDNDGDHDIFYAGGLDMGAFVGSNPGALLQNDGQAHFSRDPVALPGSDYHLRRNPQGSAIGDLNNDGFVDIVSVSNMNWPTFMPLIPYPFALGGDFDNIAAFWPTFNPVDPNDINKGFVWNGVDPEDGTLSVMINSGDNGNKSVTVRTLGTVGITSNGVVNRDGIGSVISFTPAGSDKAAMKPIVSGGSHTAASALAEVFGLGSSSFGTLDVMWPGGMHNKLYRVRAGEEVVFPEIPCSYTDKSLNPPAYLRCVSTALYELRQADVLDSRGFLRFFYSAVRAYNDEHRG